MVAAQPASMRKVGQVPHPAVNAPRPAQGQKQIGPKPNQEHLAQWMNRHSTLPLAQQQHALENEPGFRDLPSQTQQRMRDRLTQLNNMTPEQRRRILDRTEQIEHLTPTQRQQWHGASEGGCVQKSWSPCRGQPGANTRPRALNARTTSEALTTESIPTKPVKSRFGVPQEPETSRCAVHASER